MSPPTLLERRWRHHSARAEGFPALSAFYAYQRPQARRAALTARLLEMRAWNALAPYWRPGTTLRPYADEHFAAVTRELEALR